MEMVEVAADIQARPPVRKARQPRAEPKWRRRKAARPGEIVAAGLALFSEKGFAATRMEDVARRAGVAKGTVYLYFPNKEELFKAVVRRALVPTIMRMERLLYDHQGSAADLLSRTVQTMAGLMTDSKAQAIPRLVFAEAPAFPDLARFYHDEVLYRARAVFEALLNKGIERGEFREVDVPQTVTCIVAPLLLAPLWRASIEPATQVQMDIGALARSHVDLLLGSLIRTL